MKKKVVIILFTLLLSILATSFVLGATNGTSYDEKAYSCLKDKINGKTSALSLEEQSFSLLALAYDSSFQSQLISDINKNKDSNCFPKSSCKVKDTAVATVALNYAKQNTGDLEGWLVDQEIKAKNINVFLEIDTEGKSNCTVRWDTGHTTIQITADKKVSGGGNCFESTGNNGYWLKIKTSCLDDNFTVSCANDFITTLLYQKSSGDLWYVSSDVASASANGETQHVANFSCFSNNGKDCDYEGSLWATLALQSTGHDITNLIPYLTLFASDNSKLFSDTFLYQLTTSEDYLNNIVSLQNGEGYWDLATTKGKYYDTALALLVIQSSSSDAASAAKSWLEEKQDSSGCWNSNNVRDTAFLLWAGWPKPAVGGIVQDDCSSKGYYCLSEAECGVAGGSKLDSYYCSGLKKCCSKPAIEKKCTEQGGESCGTGTECSVSLTSAADTENCCLGSCDVPGTTECDDFGYSCKDSCSDAEDTASYNCNISVVNKNLYRNFILCSFCF